MIPLIENIMDALLISAAGLIVMGAIGYEIRLRRLAQLQANHKIYMQSLKGKVK